MTGLALSDWYLAEATIGERATTCAGAGFKAVGEGASAAPFVAGFISVFENEAIHILSKRMNTVAHFL